MNHILDAACKFDPDNANHWTAEGLPKIETMRYFSGNANVSREEVNTILPDFTRATAAQWQSQILAARQGADLGPGGEPSDIAGEDATSAPVLSEELYPNDFEEVDETATLKGQVEEAEAAVREAQMQLTSAQKVLDAAVAERDKLIVQLPKHNQEQEIRNYINAQNRLRESKAQRQRQLAEQGLSEGYFMKTDPRAPIDRARSRKG